MAFSNNRLTTPHHFALDLSHGQHNDLIHIRYKQIHIFGYYIWLDTDIKDHFLDLHIPETSIILGDSNKYNKSWDPT